MRHRATRVVRARTGRFMRDGSQLASARGTTTLVRNGAVGGSASIRAANRACSCVWRRMRFPRGFADAIPMATSAAVSVLYLWKATILQER
ncbi:hypothetical protein MRX96_021599 [Rhipicephalus microplus]